MKKTRTIVTVILGVFVLFTLSSLIITIVLVANREDDIKNIEPQDDTNNEMTLEESSEEPIEEDTEGPVITLVSQTPYNVRNFTSCEKEYVFQIALNESGSVYLDEEEMTSNSDSEIYELELILGEGVRDFNVRAVDELGNESTEIIAVDGICRTDSIYGSVHPWCLQKAIIHCGSSLPDSYDTCTANYIETSCSQYH